MTENKFYKYVVPIFDCSENHVGTGLILNGYIFTVDHILNNCNIYYIILYLMMKQLKLLLTTEVKKKNWMWLFLKQMNC